MPSRRIAEEIAAEWAAQGERVDPVSMPWTRSANAALDKVAPQRKEVEEHLVGYAGTDLLSYRAEGPLELAKRQAEVWGPILAAVSHRYDVRLRTTSGVMPIAQDRNVVERFGSAMTPMDDFQLTGFHDLVTLTGSYMIGLAAVIGLMPPEKLWLASCLDEDWQAEQWGIDDEAALPASIKRRAFLHANSFYHAA